MPSPVAQHALDRGFPSDLIFTPEKAGEVNTIICLILLQNCLVVLLHKLKPNMHSCKRNACCMKLFPLLFIDSVALVIELVGLHHFCNGAIFFLFLIIKEIIIRFYAVHGAYL